MQRPLGVKLVAVVDGVDVVGAAEENGGVRTGYRIACVGWEVSRQAGLIVGSGFWARDQRCLAEAVHVGVVVVWEDSLSLRVTQPAWWQRP